MNPYLMTITFLTLLSILTSSEVARFADSSLNKKMYELYVTNAVEVEELHAHSLLEEFKASKNAGDPKDSDQAEQEKTPEFKKITKAIPRSASLHFNLARPPNNSRLNLWEVLFEYQLSEAPASFSLYDSTARLIRSLYGHCSFFQAIPDAEHLILDKLMAKKDQTADFKFPDDLSAVSMDDQKLQQIFYYMLTGTTDAPSLLEYITFDVIETQKGQEKKVNLMFASPLVLQAILQNEALVGDLVRTRERYWAEMIDQETHRKERTKGKGRSDYKRALKNDFTRIFQEHGLNEESYLKVFDIGLGHYGTIILVEDPQTHKTVRKKFIRKIRSIKEE